MRIGILGGSFNPIHKGHIYLAEEALKKLKLDKIIFIPTKITPLRSRAELIDANERYKLVKLAIEDYDRFEISRYEIDKGGLSYTVDTLKALKRKFGSKTKLFFIAGSDVANELDKWKNFDELSQIASFVIAKRPNFKLPGINKNIMTIDINALDISSSKVRKTIRAAKDFKNLVPDKIYNYIKERGLYKH